MINEDIEINSLEPPLEEEHNIERLNRLLLEKVVETSYSFKLEIKSDFNLLFAVDPLTS